jgi:hypothetical protein
MQILFTERMPATDFGSFLPVGAHHAHAGKILLRPGAESAELLLRPFETRVHLASEPQHEERQPDHGEQRHRGEGWGDAQHHGQREEPAEDGIGEVHDRGPGGHAHGTQVVGEPCHQIAGAPARIPGGIERGEPREEIPAQVGFDVAAHPVEGVSHGESEHAGDGRCDHHHQTEAE